MFLIMMVALFACKDEQKQQQTWVETKEKTLTNEEKTILDAAIDNYLYVPGQDAAKSVSMGITNDDEFLTREKYEKTTFTRLPLYTFDTEKFMENPCEEQVMKCIQPAKDKMLFAGHRDGKMVMSIDIQRTGEEWFVGNLGIEHEESFARNYGDLPQLAAQTDEHKYNFLEFMHQLYLFYKIGGKTYFSVLPNNERWTTARFAEMALELYKYNQQCEEGMKEMTASTTHP